MKSNHWPVIGLLLALALLASGTGGGQATALSRAPQASMDTGFSYQGRLTVDGAPVTGDYDFRFSLWDVLSGGSPVSNFDEHLRTSVNKGLFNVIVDFRSEYFDGSPRFLQVETCPSSAPGEWVVLDARQPLQPTPFAMFAFRTDWNGILGIPAGFTDGVDNDTTYSNGSGLSLAGTVFSVNFGGTGAAGSAARSDHNHDSAYVNEGQMLSVSNGMIMADAITTSKIYDNSVTSAKINDGTITSIDIQNGTVTAADLADGAGSGIDADLLDGQHAAFFQARVSGTCSPGSTIRAIAADGTVTCQPDAPMLRSSMPASNTQLLLVGSGTNEGPFSSISTGPDGLPYIAYTSITSGKLRLLRCANWECSSVTNLPGSWPIDGGAWPSLAFAPDGKPTVAYVGNNHVRLLRCLDLDCAAWSIMELDSTTTAQYTDLTFGRDGMPLISYYNSTYMDLKVVHCTVLDCTSTVQVTILDESGPTGAWASITLGGDGLGLIAYEDGIFNLRVAHCTNVNCTSATLSTVDHSPAGGFKPAIITGADGLGLISYHFFNGGIPATGSLKTAHCANAACTSFSLAVHDSADNSGTDSSVTVGADGLGIISYQNATFGNLQTAHCADLACSLSTISQIDYLLDEGYETSISIAPDGLPMITHYDLTNMDIRFVRCSNPFCLPYFRRR